MNMTLSPTKNPQGRKCLLLDAGRMARLRDAIIVGNTIETACNLAGISRKSYYRWLKEAEDAPEGHILRQFRDTVKEARAEAAHRMLMIIQKAAMKDWRAAAWFLERRYPEDWSRPRQISGRGDYRSKGRGISQPSRSSKPSSQKATPAKRARASQLRFSEGSAA